MSNVMTIRDVFAVHAMSALITSPKVNNESGNMTDADYAYLAYVMADAMLRQKDVDMTPKKDPEPKEEEKVSEEA